MNGLDRDTEKDLLNSLLYWLTRPYAAALALAFLLLPSVTLLRALESGADFLNIGPGARASAMGAGNPALASDAGALYYNPAGLAGMRRGAALTHTAWALDGSYDFAAAAFPAGAFTGGIAFTRLDHGSFDARDGAGGSSGGFSASDKALSLAGAAKAGSFGFGAGVKLLASDIAGYSATAVALDLGATHRAAGSPLTLGLAVRNLGAGYKFLDTREQLPLTFSAGAALAVLPGVNLAAEYSRLVRERRGTFSVGTEYGLASGLALRGGYAAALGGGQGSLSGGVGLNAGRFTLDYSFAPFGDFDTTRKLSLAMAF